MVEAFDVAGHRDESIRTARAAERLTLLSGGARCRSSRTVVVGERALPAQPPIG